MVLETFLEALRMKKLGCEISCPISSTKKFSPPQNFGLVEVENLLQNWLKTHKIRSQMPKSVHQENYHVFFILQNFSKRVAKFRQ